MLASPIGWMGGKSRLRKTILEKIPEHVCWVELFCGAAWITFAKDKQISKTEVVNDTNGELSNFFRCVRDKYLELVAKIEFRVASEQDFEMIKQSWGGGSLATTSEVERAANFYWYLKNAYSGKYSSKASFGYAPIEEIGL